MHTHGGKVNSKPSTGVNSAKETNKWVRKRVVKMDCLNFMRM